MQLGVGPRLSASLSCDSKAAARADHLFLIADTGFLNRALGLGQLLAPHSLKLETIGDYERFPSRGVMYLHWLGRGSF